MMMRPNQLLLRSQQDKKMSKAACVYHSAIASVGKGKSCRSNTQHLPLLSPRKDHVRDGITRPPHATGGVPISQAPEHILYH
ncbi:hypothetical protein BGY98DRAFT_558629 [Russula aff. rugulosa BPL654]|nr:hypothetical protein BGY98DRAFT_558629 [Russula aff. rugulosa BPL654]